MNSSTIPLLVMLMWLSVNKPLSAALVVQQEISPVKTSTTSNDRFQYPIEYNKSKKKQKKIQQFTKRLDRKNNSFGNVFSSRKFQLGLLLLVVGIALAIAINIFSLAQILGWLAGIISFAGIVLMVWALIEFS